MYLTIQVCIHIYMYMYICVYLSHDIYTYMYIYVYVSHVWYIYVYRAGVLAPHTHYYTHITTNTYLHYYTHITTNTYLHTHMCIAQGFVHHPRLEQVWLEGNIVYVNNNIVGGNVYVVMCM